MLIDIKAEGNPESGTVDAFLTDCWELDCFDKHSDMSFVGDYDIGDHFQGIQLLVGYDVVHFSRQDWRYHSPC